MDAKIGGKDEDDGMKMKMNMMARIVGEDEDAAAQGI